MPALSSLLQLASGPLLAKSDRLPNQEALALGPIIGWLTFLAVVCVFAIVVIDRERFRSFWMRTDDPRSLGLFRILFCFTLLLNINNLWPHFYFLFTDEGLYLSDSARHFQAGGQFRGFGEGMKDDPSGFFDLAAVLAWLKGPRYSLLYFWDSPSFFWYYITAFEIFTIAFMLGFKTRITGFVSLILTLGLFNRSPIHQSGADVVFRVMFVYLVLSRCGHSYSIDNWLRCRRLRARGELDGRGGAGKGAGAVAVDDKGNKTLKQAIYRRIPAWPRTFMIMQLATIYLWTGSAKTGHIWWKGDSLYYALNLDHFSRVPTAYAGYIFGTNIFRWMTWVVHTWQIGFSVMVVGLIVRWARREKLDPPAGRQRWALRAAWLSLALVSLSIILVGLPVHYPDRMLISLPTLQWLVGIGGLGLIAFVGWGWWRLRERPFHFTIRGVDVTLDLNLFCSIFMGRKLWLALGFIFHFIILTLLNIGMFAPVMIVAYIACLNGTEVATIFRRTAKALGRLGVPGIPQWVKDGEYITPTESRTLEAPHLHRDTQKLPAAILGASFFIFLMAVLSKVAGREIWWVILLLALALPLAHAIVDALFSPKVDPDSQPLHTPLAYGNIGRTIVSTFIALQIAAVAGWAIPPKACTKAFRTPTRAIVRPWLHATQTFQSWNMFAPNPLRSNVFMDVFVTDADGERWDLVTDANSPRNKENPWFVYDRMGKITRRISGNGKHYQKWFARYHCRTWALEHGGVVPKKVELYKRWYNVPSPERMREHGPYRPDEYLEEHGQRKKLLTVHCARAPDGQPTNELRLRHGLEPVDESEIRRAVRPLHKSWIKRQEAKAKKAETAKAKLSSPNN
jgi:hypothetical protein